MEFGENYMSTSKEEILNKSIKEKLMNSQKIDSFWESFCDCISPELNIINNIADEIKNLYDVDKTSDIKSIGEMFGYSPNLIIKNNKDYQKLEVLSIPDRIRKKTTYSGYNFGPKQLGINSDTFNFYWDGTKLIRAIKEHDTFDNIVNWDKSSNFTEVIADKNYSNYSNQDSLYLDNQEFLDNMRLDYSKYTQPTHHIGVEYITTNNKYQHFNTLKTTDGYKYFSYLFFAHKIDINSVIVTNNGEKLEPISHNNNVITYENGYFDISQSYIEFNFDDESEKEITVSYCSDGYLIDYLYFNYLNKCSVYNKRVPIVHHNGFQINDKITSLTTDNDITSYLLPIDKLNSVFMKLDSEFKLDEDLVLDKVITEKESVDNYPRYVSMGTQLKRNIYPYIDDDVSKIAKYYSLTNLATDEGLIISNDITIEKLNNINLTTSESMYLTSESYLTLISTDISCEFSFIVRSDGEIYNNEDLKIYSEQNELHIVGNNEITFPLNYGDEHRIIIQKNENVYEIFMDKNDNYFTIESNGVELEKHHFGKYLSSSANFYIWNLITRENYTPTNLLLQYLINDYEVIFNDIRNPIKVFELSDSEILSIDNRHMINTILPYPKLEDTFYENKYVFSEKPKLGSIVLTDEFGNQLNENLSNDIIDSNNNIVGNYNDDTSTLIINDKITLVNNESFVENAKEEKTLTKTIYRDNSFKYFDSGVEETNVVKEISTPIFINGKYKTTNGNVITQDDNNVFYLNDKIIKPVYIEEYYDKISFMIDDKFYDSFREDGLNEILKVKLNEPYDTEYDIYSINGNLYLYPELNENYRIRIWRIENKYDSTEAIVNDNHTFEINTVENVYYTYCYSLGNNTSELYDSLSFARKQDVVSDIEIIDFEINELSINYEIENWKIVTIKSEESEEDSELIAYVDNEKLILEKSSSVDGTKLNIEVNPLILIIDEENYSVDCEIENSVSRIDVTLKYKPVDNKIKILYTTSDGVSKIVDCDDFGTIEDEYVTGIYRFNLQKLEVNLKDESLSFVDFNCQYVYEIDNEYYNRHFVLNYQLTNPIDVCEIGIYNKNMVLLSYTKFPYVELVDNSYISVCMLLDYGV